MDEERMISKVKMECPICDTEHAVEKRIRVTSTIIKGEFVDYEETYFLCTNSNEEEREFVTGKMENENLLNARKAYMKLSSDKKEWRRGR